jgi:hypothetical protein
VNEFQSKVLRRRLRGQLTDAGRSKRVNAPDVPGGQSRGAANTVAPINNIRKFFYASAALNSFKLRLNALLTTILFHAIARLFANRINFAAMPHC